MKQCRQCKKRKPLSDFYVHKRMADGHLNKCKACVKKRVNVHREANIEEIRSYDRARGKKQHRRKLRKNYYYRIRKDPIKWERYKKSQVRWIKLNKEKRQCHLIVSNEIKSGRLKNKPCQKCGSKRTHAHHEDYSKPLDVVWLCKKHHGERHREINEEKRKCSS